VSVAVYCCCCFLQHRLFVCVCNASALCKWLYRLMSFLGWRFLGDKAHCIRWGSRFPHGDGGDSVWPSPNYYGHSLLLVSLLSSTGTSVLVKEVVLCLQADELKLKRQQLYHMKQSWAGTVWHELMTFNICVFVAFCSRRRWTNDLLSLLDLVLCILGQLKEFHFFFYHLETPRSLSVIGNMLLLISFLE